MGNNRVGRNIEITIEVYSADIIIQIIDNLARLIFIDVHAYGRSYFNYDLHDLEVERSSSIKSTNCRVIKNTFTTELDLFFYFKYNTINEYMSLPEFKGVYAGDPYKESILFHILYGLSIVISTDFNNLVYSRLYLRPLECADVLEKYLKEDLEKEVRKLEFESSLSKEEDVENEYNTSLIKVKLVNEMISHCRRDVY